MVDDTKYLAIDMETEGLSFIYNKIIGIGRVSLYPDYSDYGGRVPITLLTQFEHVFHNGTFDMKFGRRWGIAGLRYDHDTLLMASLLPHNNEDDKEMGLEALAVKYLGDIPWKIKWDKETPSVEEIKEHCLKDCNATYRLFNTLKTKLKQEDLWDYYTTCLMPLARLILDVEYRGVKLDITLLQSKLQEYTNKIESLQKDFSNTFANTIKAVEDKLLLDAKSKVKPGKKENTYKNRIYKLLANPPIFNIQSNVHMSTLMDVVGLDIVDMEGKRTTSSKTLPYYINKHPIIKHILEYREVKKIHEFLKVWDTINVGGYLYPTFRLYKTRTGRLSGAEPNLQQVPKDLRDLFIPNAGNVFVITDMSQVEPRLAAHFSGDKNLQSIFKSKQDLYSMIALKVLKTPCKLSEVKEKYPEQRSIAKQLTLAIFYGMGAAKLAYSLKYDQNIKITEEEAREYINNFYDNFPDVKKFKYRLGALALKDGYIRGWFGRKLWLDKDNAQHKALNYFIQNAASELTALSQIKIQKKLEGIAKLRLIVHDEVVYECKQEDAQKVLDIVKEGLIYSVSGLSVPLDVESFIGTTWGAKK